MLDQRDRLLVAAPGFAACALPSYDRALWALRTWLESWGGIGHVAVGIHSQGYNLQLTQYDDRGWRATFSTTGWSTHRRARHCTPKVYVLGSGNESFRDSLPDQWSSHAFQVRGNGRLFHEK